MAKVLGSTTKYPDKYSPQILEAIPRTSARLGVDIWTCYEVSWCDPSGKPQVAIAQMAVPASSPNIVESKSLKLYLNSVNNEQFTQESLVQRWTQDLGACIGVDIELKLFSPSEWHVLNCVALEGRCIDSVEPKDSIPWIQKKELVSETLYTHLFRSLCPVTGQPDWATIDISYTGMKFDESRLLHELTHHRNKQGFHESCVDDLFDTILKESNCEALTVSGYFTRRGGIDITPIRTTEDTLPSWKRQFRQ